MLTADSVARLGAVLGDRTRVAMCLALLDGRAWTAGELAAHAQVSRSTASEHLDVLLAAGLVSQVRQGRHRYVRLAGPQAAQTVEDIAATAGVPERPSSSRSVRVARRLALARTCYDHLAGALGVAILDAMVARDLVTTDAGLALTDDGRNWFRDLRGGAEAVRGDARRPALRPCLDWTERRDHLGGALAAELRAELVRRDWLVPATGDRSVAVTPSGAAGLHGLLGLDTDRLGTDDVGTDDVGTGHVRTAR